MHDKNAVRVHDRTPVDSWVGSTIASDPALTEINFVKVALGNPKRAATFEAAYQELRALRRQTITTRPCQALARGISPVPLREDALSGRPIQHPGSDAR